MCWSSTEAGWADDGHKKHKRHKRHKRFSLSILCILCFFVAQDLMSVFEVKSKGSCRWDVVSLGEVMLRLDPGEGRVSTTRQFQVWEGGGEYNVARGLKRCFGMDAAVVTALADNAVGRLGRRSIYQGGVDQSHLKGGEVDGVGRPVRNGLNLAERGCGLRAAAGCS